MWQKENSIREWLWYGTELTTNYLAKPWPGTHKFRNRSAHFRNPFSDSLVWFPLIGSIWIFSTIWRGGFLRPQLSCSATSLWKNICCHDCPMCICSATSPIWIYQLTARDSTLPSYRLSGAH